MKYDINMWKGRKVNKWTILSVGASYYPQEPYWMCLCECGTVKSVRASHAARGLSKGCPHCKNKKLAGLHPYFMTAYRFSAERRGISFNITLEDVKAVFKRQAGRCAFTGAKLSLPQQASDKKFTASIDRINSSAGYSPDNIQFVTKDINMMKQTRSDEEFITICEAVTKQRGGKCDKQK